MPTGLQARLGEKAAEKHSGTPFAGEPSGGRSRLRAKNAQSLIGGRYAGKIKARKELDEDSGAYHRGALVCCIGFGHCPLSSSAFLWVQMCVACLRAWGVGVAL